MVRQTEQMIVRGDFPRVRIKDIGKEHRQRHGSLHQLLLEADIKLMGLLCGELRKVLGGGQQIFELHTASSPWQHINLKGTVVCPSAIGYIRSLGCAFGRYMIRIGA